MPEFALVAPVLFLIIFGIFDLGRGIVAYVSIQQAANEGARVAAEGAPTVGGVPPYTPPCTLLSSANCSVTPNAGAIDATIADTGAVKLAPASCPNGPVPFVASVTASPVDPLGGKVLDIPANSGWVYVTDPENPTSNVRSATTPANNAAGGDSTNTALNGKCYGTNPASTSELQVTVIYHFRLIVPGFLHLPSDLTLWSYSLYETEY